MSALARKDFYVPISFLMQWFYELIGFHIPTGSTKEKNEIAAPSDEC